MTPTPEGKQLAADLANAERESVGDYLWQSADFNDGILETALARLATEHLALKAELAEAKADLREIAELLAPQSIPHASVDQCATIAAKWRVETDPLVEAMKAAKWFNAEALASQLRAELAKRGYEIGGKS